MKDIESFQHKIINGFCEKCKKTTKEIDKEVLNVCPVVGRSEVDNFRDNV